MAATYVTLHQRSRGSFERLDIRTHMSKMSKSKRSNRSLDLMTHDPHAFVAQGTHFIYRLDCLDSVW